MKNTKKTPYIILGLGVGIILTTSIYSIFPKVKYNPMTDDMIIERAKELGMVGLKESMNKDNTIEPPVEIPEENIETPEETPDIIPEEPMEEPKKTEEEKIEENPIVKEELPKYPRVVLETPVENLGESVEFIVQNGDTLGEVADLLKEKTLITDTLDFIIYVKSVGLDKKIRVGNFQIRENSSYKDIMNILTKKVN